MEIIIAFLLLALAGVSVFAFLLTKKVEFLKEAVEQARVPNIVLGEVTYPTDEDYSHIRGAQQAVKSVITIIKYQLALALEDGAKTSLSDHEVRINQGKINAYAQMVNMFRNYIVEAKDKE